MQRLDYHRYNYQHVYESQKCEEPAKSKDILGMNFNSKEKACFLATAKVTKYKSRLVNSEP